MVDECTDVSNQEQAIKSTAVNIRWVDDTQAVHENFISLYSLDTIKALSIVSPIRDTLARLNLPIAKACGQWA